MLLSLLLFPLLSLAAPSPQSPTAQTNHHHHGEDLYYIRTTDSEKPSYNNLYISAYHTGAGLNDAVAQASKENAAKGFLNETYQQFAFGTDFPWGMVIGSTANYAQWGNVEINVGQGTPGFSIDGGRLKWNGGQGWLICDWVHGVPQLFWLQKSEIDQFPSNCAKADLRIERV